MKKKIRIPIKYKVFGLVAFLVFVALVTILFQTSRIFKADKADFVKEMSAKLASSTAKNISDKIAAIQDKLIVFIGTKESLSQTKARMSDQSLVLFSRYGEFQTIALMTENEAGNLKLEWLLRNPTADAQKWPPDFERNFLNQLQTKAATQTKRWFWKTQAPDGQWLSVLGFSVDIVEKQEPVKAGKKAAPAPVASSSPKVAWIIGFLPSSMLQNMIGDFNTGISTSFIVDDEGVAIASSDTKLKLRNLSAHPVVAEVLKKNRPSGTGDFVDTEDKGIVGSFELIPKMNLGVVVTTPKEKAFEAASVLVKNIIFIGFVIMVAAVATAIILSNYMTKPLQRLAKVAAQIGSGDFTVPVSVETNDEIGDLAQSFHVMEKSLIERDAQIEHSKNALVQSEKMSAFGQLSAGIAHEVKNPLAGILGHAQLAMGKIQNDDVKKHLDVIEKETRRCKAIVENLMKFARAEKIELQPTDLAQVAQDTINLVEHQLSLAGCKIYKDFQPCPMVLANGNQLQQVLLNLMVNASHAMENSANKNVILHVKQAGNKAQIQVEDTGAGMSPEIQKKIFEPFFTTKPAGKGTGLGLSVSIGIVKDHKGEIYLKSEVNQGTTFFIDIPIPENARMPDKALENTHGGTFLTADSKALKDNMAHEKKMATAAQLKPTESQQTAVTGKQIDKELNDFDARKAASGKAEAAKVEAAKPVKPTAPKVETPSKVETPKPAVATTTETVTKTLPKLDLKTPGKPVSKPETKPVELKVVEAPKPEAPKEVAKKDLPKVEALKVEVPKTDIPKIQVPKLNTAKPEEKVNDDTFKVNIKRPKIK